MKTSEYVKKYKLNESDKFSHSLFVEDLSKDFNQLIDNNKATESFSKFRNCIKEIKNKFDSINNKTNGVISEGLWKFFYATIVIIKRDNLFSSEERFTLNTNYKKSEYNFHGSF